MAAGWELGEGQAENPSPQELHLCGTASIPEVTQGRGRGHGQPDLIGSLWQELGLGGLWGSFQPNRSMILAVPLASRDIVTHLTWCLPLVDLREQGSRAPSIKPFPVATRHCNPLCWTADVEPC